MCDRGGVIVSTVSAETLLGLLFFLLFSFFFVLHNETVNRLILRNQTGQSGAAAKQHIRDSRDTGHSIAPKTTSANAASASP